MTDNEQVERFDGPAEAVEWMTGFTLEAKRTVDIFSHSLSPQLYCHAQWVEALSAFTRRSARSRLRVLLRDSRPLHGRDHPVVSLCRRLPSHTAIRILCEDLAPPDVAWLCIDECDLVFFNNEPGCFGFARRAARAESRHFLASYEQWWQSVSKTDPNLKLLSI